MQAFPHVDPLLSLETEVMIEPLDFLIGGQDLKIDFQASPSHENLFDMSNQRGADSLAPLFRLHSKRVYPSTVPIVSRHDCPNHFASRLLRHKEKTVIVLYFLSQGKTGIIMGRVVGKHAPPQRDHLCSVV